MKCQRCGWECNTTSLVLQVTVRPPGKSEFSSVVPYEFCRDCAERVRKRQLSAAEEERKEVIRGRL
jgi:hypothetical protein